MQFKDRIQVIHARSSIAIRFELTKGFLKSTTTKPQYAQYIFQKMVHTKIIAMVRQRRYQIGSYLAPTTGRFAPAWDSLLDAIQTILEVEDISTELNNLIYG
ncbi:hypothetical protein Oweho_3239 [Owenweeksia hongkongensis DSM 17368]|uniref:Uncharacterized protein n=1 Tax=Owenweeksia hongkongensis (strain DSM 17368 / CIP 108786 / JCM 12287 / NRRL B-23963 / UST20020801) TaxID=926562 RepID=G8R490_OWEHD|nr:hypothetical protein [Owenweeksia hongkongensis]AEV34190.1 hypothetical protein Oweho_3239 [Owenweeksia hongkongensis DSM 17368]